jgi:iron complex transport system substrate-binding protein
VARRLLLLIPVLLFPLLLAVACGGGDGSPEPPAAAAVDLTRDDLGRSVNPPANASRVVALSPSIVELMFAVGATPVGRPASATYPDAALAVPSFGESRNPNLEQIINMRPDLIIADAILHQRTIEDIARLQVPVYAVKVSSFQEVVHGLRVVGALTGNREAGEKAAADLEAKFQRVKARVPGSGPSVVVLVGAGPGQFIAARDNSYLGGLIKELGGRNIVTTEPENFGYPGFTDFTVERILERDPDIIIAATIGGPPGAPTTSQAIRAHPALASLRAVREGRVYDVDPNVYIQSAGPRVSQILDELPRLLYPNVFAAR